MPFEEHFKLIVPTIENLNVMLYLLLFVRNWRFSKRTVYIASAAVILMLMPYNIWCGIHIGTERIDVYKFTPLCHAVMILLIFILGKMDHGRLLFSISSAYMLIFFCSTLTRAFENGSYYFQAFVRLIFFTAFVFVNYKIHRPRLFDAMEWIRHGWYALSLIPLSLLALFFYTSLPLDNPQYVVNYALTLEGFLIYVILLWLVLVLKKQHQAEHERSLLQTQVSAIRQHCDQLQEANMSTRIVRHDIRHYCQLLENAIVANDMESVAQILEQVRSKISVPSLLGQEGSPDSSLASDNVSSSVISLLQYYKQSAEKFYISFKVFLDMPENPSFDIVEFCVLLSNGLENAIHACIQIPVPEKRKIVVSGEMKQEQFFFEIKNTYCNTVYFENHRPVTREKGHGYGTQSICGFADKYNALVDFDTDGTWFRLRLLI